MHNIYHIVRHVLLINVILHLLSREITNQGNKRPNWNYKTSLIFLCYSITPLKMHRHWIFVTIAYLDYANKKLSTMQKFSMSWMNANHCYWNIKIKIAFRHSGRKITFLRWSNWSKALKKISYLSAKFRRYSDFKFNMWRCTFYLKWLFVLTYLVIQY